MINDLNSIKYRFPLTLYLIEFDWMARRIVFVFTPPSLADSDTENHKGFLVALFSFFSLGGLFAGWLLDISVNI